MNIKNVCVLGGGGFVGHHLVSLLAQRGIQVCVPTRRREAVKDLLVLPQVDIVETDIHDPAQLRSLFTGMDAVINLVGILHQDRRATFKHVHVELPRMVMAACQSAGVQRLLHMSALGADTASRSAYQQTKALGEKLILAAHAPDLAVSVFRPSVIFGPGDSFLTMFAQMLKLARFAPFLPLAGAEARFQPVFVGDVARAFADALDNPDTHGQAYDLCGPKVYSLRELVEITAHSFNLQPSILPLGQGLSYWFARLMELKPGRKLMTRDNHYAMLTDNCCPAGCAPQPTALETAIGYLRQAGPRRHYDQHRSQAGR